MSRHRTATLCSSICASMIFLGAVLSPGPDGAALAQRGHGHGAKARVRQDKPPTFYEVVVVSDIKDPGAIVALLPVVGSSAVDANGRVLVDATASSTPEDPAAARFAILAFQDSASAHGWRNSDAFKLVDADLQKNATVTLYESAGFADYQTPQPEPVLTGGSAKEKPAPDPSDQIPSLGPMKSICKGC